MSEYVRAYEGSKPYIFVSYAHADSARVLPVIRALYERKYRVWYDEGIAPGSEWPSNIARHLRSASLLLAFVSERSLRSPNCENEVSRAVGPDAEGGDDQDAAAASGGGKEAVQISLDGSLHPLLTGAQAFEADESLLDRLTDSLSDTLIGDGVTGYQYSIDRKRSFNRWNLMLGAAGALALIFGAALYGLYHGTFDPWLPARQTVAQTAAPTARPQEAIAVDSHIIGSVLPVSFSSEEEKNAVYDKLGWEQPYEMTYKDLMEMDWVTNLEIWDEPIEDLSFAAYLPSLEVISLHGARVTDLTPLVECPGLRTVQVTADMLPMILPEIRGFEVEVL